MIRIGSNIENWLKFRHCRMCWKSDYQTQQLRQPIGIIIDGQSNAKGRALISSLPSYLTGSLTGIFIWYNGEWQTLEAGVNNMGSSTIPNLTTHGIEMEFAYRVKQQTRRDIYILKRGIGSSRLPETLGEDDHSVNSVNEYHQDIIDLYNGLDNRDIDWKYYVWAQGENSVNNGDSTALYQIEWQLKADALFSVFGMDYIIDYLMPSWLSLGNPTNVNAAKNAVAVDSRISVYDSDGYSNIGDDIHLDTDGFKDFVDDIMEEFY